MPASGYTTVSASSFCDAHGTPIANATISFQPCTVPGAVPIAFRGGGTGEGQRSSQPVFVQCVNGAFTIDLCDTSETLPINIGYLVTAEDNVSGASLLGPGYIIQPLGAAFNFDGFQPNLAGMVSIQTGPQGIQGPSGVVSGVETAFAVTRSQNGNVFNPNTVTMDAVLATSGAIISISNDPRFFVSDFIVVVEGGHIVCNTDMLVSATGYPQLGLCYYDITRTYVSGVSGVSAGTALLVPTGQNIAYARFSCGTGGTDGSGAFAVAAYLASTLPASASATSQLLSAVAIVNGNNDGNLIQAESIVTGSYINSVPADPYFGQTPTGLDVRFWLTGYFPVVPGGTLVSNTNMFAAGYNAGLVFFDQNKRAITGQTATAGTAITVPTTAVWARASGFSGTNVAASLVIVNGSTLPPNYAYPGLSAYTSNQLVALVGAKPLAGKRWIHFGDSISAIYSGGWLPEVLANTGMIQVGQDAQTGRGTGGIFDMFSGAGGTFNPAAASGVENLWANGISQWLWNSTQTLAQNLVSLTPDVITIYLGTNDTGTTPGTPGDAANSGTMCGYVRAAIEPILAAVPNARIMWIAPYPPSYGTTTIPAINAAIRGTCALYGVPVLDLNAESGICTQTIPYYLLLDPGQFYVHPNANGCNMLARLVSNFINQKY